MVDIQPVQDIFGLGRLAQTIRQGRIDEQNRGLAEQQATTRGLQQEALELGIQEKRGSLADLAQQRGVQSELGAILSGPQQVKPSEVDELTGLPISEPKKKSRTMQAIEFLKTKDPERAQELITSTLTNAGRIAKFNPQGGIDFANNELGTAWTLSEETPDTFTVDQGDKKVLINKATGDVIKEFPVIQKPSEQKPTSLIQNLEAAGLKQGTKEFTDAVLSNIQKGNRTIRSLPGGGFEIIEGGGAKKRPKFSEVQSKSGGFADRVQRANKIANDLEDTEGFDPANLGETIATSIPLIGNTLLSPEKQKYEQSKRDFVSAVLRLESGAAIAQSEFDSANKLYFPQVGDSPEVIAQKRASRDFQFDILKAAGAGSFENIQRQRESDTQGETPKISNIEQFNSLPSGTIYQQEDGQTFQKP